MGENLPINSKNSSIASKGLSIKFSDFRKRAGKVILGLGGATIGIIASAGAGALSVPVLPAVLFVGSVGLATIGASNILYKSEPGLIFVTRRQSDGSRMISQSSLKVPTYLRDISNADKACIMGLQTLIGIQRYKTELRKTGENLVDSNGKKVYPQKYSTITHSININNLKALEKAGYIEIVGEEEEFKHNVFSRKAKPMRSLLIFEKIGFSNTEGLKQIFKVAKSGNKEELDKLRQTFKKVMFRLTDKDIDFEDIYKKVNGYVEYESKEEKSNLKRLRLIFGDSNSRIPGVLSGKRVMNESGKFVYSDRKKKIDIVYDKFGRPILEYNSSKSFGEKIEETFGIPKVDRNARHKFKREKNFEAELRKGVDLKKFQGKPNISPELMLQEEKEEEK